MSGQPVDRQYQQPSEGRPASRRAFLGAAAGLAGAGLLGACSSAGRSVGTASCVSGLKIPAKTPPHRPGEIISSVKGNPIAWTSYPKPYRSISGTPGSGGTVSTFQILYAAPPTKLSKNRWWQELNKRLGVTIQPNLAPSDSYGTKLQTLAASGSFPDITYINFLAAPGADAFQKTVSEGAFNDLTSYLTGSALEEFPNLQLFPEYTWKDASFEGKIYGVPRPEPQIHSTLPLYRRDWARKLGVDEPKNANDVMAMFVAFAKEDPNGDGKKNTWGLDTFHPEIWNMMFRVPNNWRREKSGKLVNAIETEEYKEALHFASKLWKAGAFYPDAATVTPTQSLNLFFANQTGTDTQGLTVEMQMIEQRQAQLHQESLTHPAFYPFLPPGHDGGKGSTILELGCWGFAGIPSRIKDKGKIKELLHIIEYYSAPFGSEEFTFMTYGIEGWNFKYDKNGAPVALNNNKAANDMSLCYLTETFEIAYFFPTDPGLPKLAQDITAEALERAVPDPTAGLYSPTQVSKGSSLTQMQTDYYNAIVMGRKPLSALDEWRSSWKSQGGDQIRREYQQALKKCAA